MIKDLMYIELKTGYSDDGPAWIGYVRTSKTKKTIYLSLIHIQMCIRDRYEPLFLYFFLEHTTDND